MRQDCQREGKQFYETVSPQELFYYIKHLAIEGHLT